MDQNLTASQSGSRHTCKFFVNSMTYITFQRCAERTICDANSRFPPVESAYPNWLRPHGTGVPFTSTTHREHITRVPFSQRTDAFNHELTVCNPLRGTADESGCGKDDRLQAQTTE